MTKKELLESKKLLKEDGIETTLMVAGFIPVIGEIADIILIIRYLYKKEYLYAALMLVALVPTVGDFLVKPFIRLFKSGAGKAALRSTDDMVAFLKANPKAASMYQKIVPAMEGPLVNKTVKQLEKVPGIGSGIGSRIRESISQHKTVFSRLFQKPVDIGKSITRASQAGASRPIARGVKDYFQGQRLEKYFARTGQVPSNWLSKWYNIVYKARGDRRKFVRNFIVANNLLDFFGLPSLEAFDDKFENDAKFREQAMKNPAFADAVQQSTTGEDIAAIEGKTSGVGDVVQGVMGLKLIKMLAQGIQ